MSLHFGRIAKWSTPKVSGQELTDAAPGAPSGLPDIIGWPPAAKEYVGDRGDRRLVSTLGADGGVRWFNVRSFSLIADRTSTDNARTPGFTLDSRIGRAGTLARGPLLLHRGIFPQETSMDAGTTLPYPTRPRVSPGVRANAEHLRASLLMLAGADSRVLSFPPK